MVHAYRIAIDYSSIGLPWQSTPEAQLHPAEKCESRGNRKSQRDVRQTRTLQQVHNCQQRKAQTDAQVPPSPVPCLKSAHEPIVNQRLVMGGGNV